MSLKTSGSWTFFKACRTCCSVSGIDGFPLRVAVQALEEEVDADPVEEHDAKTGQREPCGRVGLPLDDQANVHDYEVHDPRHQGKRLFRIPAPRPPPRLIRPDGPAHDADAQEPEGHL